MFERKTFTIYPVRATRRPIFIRASSARDAIYEFGWMTGLATFEIHDKADAGDIAYLDFTLGSCEKFYCYETLPTELVELGATS